jgi:cell volume regulation protein A
VSEHDAAAVFAVLKGSGLHLKRRVGATLELESGINDPMAVILMTTMTRQLVAPGAESVAAIALETVLQIVVGAGLGVAIGYAGARRARARAAAHRRALSGAHHRHRLPRLQRADAAPRQRLPRRVRGRGDPRQRPAAVPPRAAARARRARLAEPGGDVPRARAARVPRRGCAGAAGVGLALALFLADGGAPARRGGSASAPFRAYARRDVAYVGWVGLRGAVPIVLATYPVLARRAGRREVFDSSSSSSS